MRHLSPVLVLALVAVGCSSEPNDFPPGLPFPPPGAVVLPEADAGQDAGTADAGTTDAGTTDAGTTDAGTSDAGTEPDAGVTDAGTEPDAGTDPDAGTQTDAGVPELTDTSEAGIVAFVQSQQYLQWTPQIVQRANTDHNNGVQVRTWVNPALYQSLKAAQFSHPVGSTAVLEYFAADGTTLLGHGVIAKREQAMMVEHVFFLGDAPYTTNSYQTGSNATCTSCHTATTDHILATGTHFP
jgi:hypothetical protein